VDYFQAVHGTFEAALGFYKKRSTFAGEFVEAFSSSSALGSGVAVANFDDCLLFEPVERGVEGPRCHFSLNAKCDIAADADAVLLRYRR
jgi:hypothetical protein